MNNLPMYMIQRLQKIQNATASFVLGKHAKIVDVISLSWLPITERFEYSIAVLAFKAININIPSNMKLRIKKNQRSLRSNSSALGIKIDSNENVQTFQEDAKAVFNNLSKNIRECKELSTFKVKTKRFLLDKA